MKMKRILCGVLAAIICLSLFGCGKNEKVEPDAPKDETVNNVDVTTYVPEENPVAAEPQYESAHMSVQTFEDNFAYENNVNRTIIDSINGNILDIYQDQIFYTLTDKGIYQCAWMFDSSSLNINPGDNTKIHFVGYQNVVLSDDNGKITIYYKDINNDGIFHSYTDDNMVMGEDDFVIVEHGTGGFEETVIIVKDITRDGIVATVVEAVWGETYDDISMQTTSVDKLFPFSENLGAEIKSISFAHTNDNCGILLLENGDLYSFDMYFYHHAEEAKVQLKAIDTDVNRVVRVISKDAVKYIKNNDDDYIYYYRTGLEETGENWVPELAKIRMPDGYSTKDITDAIVEHDLVKLNDTWYSVSNHSVSYEHELWLSLSDFESKYKDSIDFGWAPVVQNGKVSDFLANNWTSVEEGQVQFLTSGKFVSSDWALMDDGYIYQYIYE